MHDFRKTLRVIVHELSTPDDVATAMSELVKEWELKEPVFMSKWKRQYSERSFSRASLPAGYPRTIVNILEPYNLLFKKALLGLEKKKLPLLTCLKELVLVVERYSFENSRVPTHPLHTDRHTLDGPKRRITRTWQLALAYNRNGWEQRPKIVDGNGFVLLSGC